MERQAMLEDRIRVIADLCRRGLDPDALRVAILQRLRRTVPVDALWWALTDPSTLLFTRTYREEIPEKTASYFVANEFLSRDVNRWTEVAREREGVRTLAQATGGRLHESARYRDVFEPLGLGDELRAAFRVEGTCWGLVCLHRERGRRFTEEEAGFIQRVAPHIAYGIRAGLVLGTIEPTDPANAPGVVV